MPTTFTRTPPETERRDTGFGGKPPLDHRPTGGGGDGEDWDKRQPGGHGPHELLSRYRMAIFFVLAADMMFFVALISAFFARQAGGHFSAANVWVLDWRTLALPPILWVNTAVLLLSTFTMEMARRQFFREIDVMDEWLGLGHPTVRRAAPWLIATVVLGCLFIAGQVVAWGQLVKEGVYFSTNPSSHFFYLITGAHAIHLLAGIIALGAALISLFFLKRLEVRQAVVDCAAWYWHAMGAFWLLLFGLLLFCQ